MQIGDFDYVTRLLETTNKDLTKTINMLQVIKAADESCEG